MIVNTKLRAKSVLALPAVLLLAGCFMTPGQFEAEMDIRKNGAFTFSYDGEIYMLGMNDLANMADAAETAEPCIDEETSQERPCTPEERDNREAEQAQEKAMMQAMLGGSDLSDPEMAAKFASDLERQAGWDSVEYRGDGLFAVSFSISSTLTHDFAFPLIEEMPAGKPFVTASLRDDSRMRVEASGFASQGGGPLQAMMGGMAGAFSQLESEGATPGPSMPELPQMRGTFRLTTDASILTNNTDEGPSPASDGQSLVWDIGPATMTAPSALLLLEM